MRTSKSDVGAVEHATLRPFAGGDEDVFCPVGASRVPGDTSLTDTLPVTEKPARAPSGVIGN